MGKAIVYWFIGGYVSLFFGYFITEIFHAWAFYTRIGDSDTQDREWRLVVGTIERFFFMVAVAFSVTGAILGMMGWITLKTATNQNWIEAKKDEKFGTRAMCSLLSSMVSMLFALFGGLFCLKGMIHG